MRKLIYLPALACLLLLASGFSSFQSTFPFRNGDLIFIVNPSGQGKSIQLATKSKFTHVGIVFIENGEAMVYHAVEPVSKNTAEEFIAMSADGQYDVRRLKEQSLLTGETISALQHEAESRLGIHYDRTFSWTDEELYCSEYVWKLYNTVLNIQLGTPRALREFDLSHPRVRQILEERYGSEIPLEERMISPGDMHDSPLLQ